MKDVQSRDLGHAGAADAESAEPGSEPDAGAGPLSALTMDVHITVPDDLVITADSLQAPGAPIGLGALDVTLGGDLRATKEAGQPPILVGAVNTVRGTRSATKVSAARKSYSPVPTSFSWRTSSMAAVTTTSTVSTIATPRSKAPTM